jgi:hypothetical protein
LEIIDDQKKMAYIDDQSGIAYFQPMMQQIVGANEFNTGLGSRHVQIATMIAECRHREMLEFP